MPYIKSGTAEVPVKIYYEEYGKGQTVVFIHGWPLSGSMWEYQVTSLAKKFRCIAYDRRGFGNSDRPYSGYDYDTLATDLKALLEQLNVTNVTLVGFSMGGGEIARYFSKYQGDRVSRVVLIGSILPYMLKTDDHPEGVPQEVFDGILKAVTNDRPSFFEDFNKDFYGMTLLSFPVTSAFLADATQKCLDSSPFATIDCARSFSSTDFRNEIAAMRVPTLIIHGDKDKTVPIKATSELLSEMIPGSTYKVYEGAPHGLWFTEKEKLNEDLIAFISR